MFIAVEFAGTSLSDSASYLSAVLVVPAFGAIAREIHRTPREAWTTPAVQTGVAAAA
jgi:hypothetical protein